LVGAGGGSVAAAAVSWPAGVVQARVQRGVGGGAPALDGWQRRHDVNEVQRRIEARRQAPRRSRYRAQVAGLFDRRNHRTPR
jgi:hypothetical protein